MPSTFNDAVIRIQNEVFNPKFPKRETIKLPIIVQQTEESEEVDFTFSKIDPQNKRPSLLIRNYYSNYGGQQKDQDITTPVLKCEIKVNQRY